MFAATTSAALVGATPRQVEIEAHVGAPKGVFALVGLPDTAVREAKHRVRAALASSSFEFPNRHIIVNLAPAELPKAGSAFDLAIALGVLAAARLVPVAASHVVALGELALDGTIRHARGAVAAALVSARLGLPCLVAPEDAARASLVPGADVRAVSTLAEAVDAALGGPGCPPTPPGSGPDLERLDMADVRGQRLPRRAVEIAAAGGHHLLLVGPPGTGKSMLARRLPALLPDLGADEALEVMCVWESADRPLGDFGRPPYRAPHHTASSAALLGGGSGQPVPGELALAHRGVMFLDELGEFPTNVLDGLRQPLEDGAIQVARRGYSVRFPADAQVVAATNPCPCGHRGDRTVGCRCSDRAVERYRERLSGPLLDRFDLRVWVGRPERLDGPPGEGSTAIAERVAGARGHQAERGVLNRSLPGSQLDELPTDPSAARLLAGLVARGTVSGRGHDRIRRVARTIADLSGRETVVETDVAEAVAFREAW
jgi:magnesium chelatase family protein